MMKINFLNILVITLILMILATIVYSYLYSATNNHREQRLLYFKNNPISNSDIVLIGDSQIEFFNSEKLIQPFTKHKVLNRGISGELIDELSSRIDEIVNAEPRKIIMQIGINDLLKGATVETLFKKYKYLLQRLDKNKTIVLALYPVGQNRLIKKSTIKKINIQLQGFCVEEKICFINIYNQLIEQNDFLNKMYSEDGLHLNEKGNKLLVDFIKLELE